MSGLMRRTPIEDALRERWVLRLPDCVVACQVSVDSDTVYAATASGQICALSLENGTQGYQIAAHQIGCNDLALSEAGDVLASAGQDGRLCFWDAATGQPIQEYSTAPAWVERVVAARDWNGFFVGAGKRVLAFNGRSEVLPQLGEHRATVSDMVLHPFKPQLITGSYGEVLFWHTRDLVQESRLDYKGSVLRLAMSPNGKVLATGNQDSTVRFWRTQTGKDSEMWGYTRKVRELAWICDSRFLATGGGVRLNGEPLVQHRRALRAWRQRVGLVLSDPEHMLLGATVETDLSFGPLNLGVPETEVRQMVETTMDAFGLMPWRSHAVSSLSEGTRKRVALAGMVVLKPEVLQLDEPANALDAPGQRALRAILAQLTGAGTTLIVATHDADFAWEWATHWMVMDQGRVTFFRPVDEAEQHLGAFPGVMVPHVVQCARLLRERGLLPESTPTPRTLDALADPHATGVACPH